MPRAPGATGSSGVVQTVTFGGQVGSLAGGATTFLFVGGTAAATVGAGQRLTGAGAAVLGLTSGGARFFDIDLCYQPTSPSGSPVTNLNAANYMSPHVFADRRTFAVAGSRAPGAGTYTVGICVRNTGAAAIDNNEFSNGWMIVTS